MIARFSAALLACSVLTATPAFAQSAEDLAALRAQIAALQQQVQQLQAAQEAQAAAVAKVAAAPTPVPALKEAPGWWGDTKISGKAFFNVSNINQRSTDLAGHTTDNIQNGTPTELKRFYLG